ncbi:DUF726 domain-containing protein [Vibrio parahaemolyticus]|uniref:DUF726 domain-containing protein n=1 Tax=Vibrio parahaemolyticus TaxID=670 RepID=UPI00042443B0|nr:DUF726 domain-containing protein [Vibrio parahaemolyticus]TOL98297.1 DUF726 domain-containing protein [Vibrio parahaemolyticus]HCH2417129.1 DUF726 domain-containing protein [Vibrio parahaemolyticus]
MTIRLHKVQSGDPLNVIVINGFLSEKNSDVTDWLSVLEHSFPSSTVHHYDWDGCNYEKLFRTVNIGGIGLSAVRALTAVGKVAHVGTAVGSGLFEWRKAMKNARLAGENLAKYIDNQEGCFVLLGHSLGARVIYHCLENQKTINKVKGAMLFGGAVGKENPWEELLRQHSQMNIFNCYSNKDVVLKILYRAGTFYADSPIGLNPIKQDCLNRLHNVDMSNLVSGHMRYKTSEVGLMLKAHMAFPNDEVAAFSVFMKGSFDAYRDILGMR